MSDRPANVGARNKKRRGISGEAQHTVVFEKSYFTDSVKVRVPQNRERRYSGRLKCPGGWLEGAAQG